MRCTCRALTMANTLQARPTTASSACDQRSALSAYSKALEACAAVAFVAVNSSALSIARRAAAQHCRRVAK